ncbi:MAG: cytochrome d ubiquinol oxidase subunit II [Bacteroidales bacterium]|nr:cytochrome d ubiquinol oxidase subunit II [Bacteroidales bacterium]
MILNVSYLVLQQYWWIIISALAAALVFMMFVQGGQTLIFTIAKDEKHRKLIINALGRKWELTFTTLVTFGGAFFASFPLFYATSFGGAYWVWMAILFAFVIQAVSYEYRMKSGNVYGKRFFEILLFLNGLLGTILIGTAVATFFTGSEFSVDPVTNFSRWENAAYGLEALLNFHNISLGLSVFFLARVLGLQYFILQIDNQNIIEKSRKRMVPEAILFLVFFLTFIIWLMFIDGYAYDSQSMQIKIIANKYALNVIELPLNTLILISGVGLVLWGLFQSIFKQSQKAFIYTGTGSFLTVFALFILAGFNNTCFYPSSFDPQSSLHIQNSSSSLYTLKTMSYVSLMIPFVFSYIIWVWKSINKKKINEEELNEDSHIY